MEVSTCKKRKVERTFGRCARPSKPHWIHLSNYGTKVIESTTNHIDKRKMNAELERTRRSKAARGSGCIQTP